MLFTADVALLFLLVFYSRICVAVNVDIITIPPPPAAPSLCSVLSLPTILSLIQLSVLWNQCVAKAGFGAIQQFTFRYWSPWEKFPREHHVKLWDGTNLLRLAGSASSNIVFYSRFIWLNGSMTLIRAETERYDIVDFCKVTSKSLALGDKWIRWEQTCRWTLSRALKQG